MNDRTMYGPDGPEFRAWMQRNDPEGNEFKREAAIVAARLDDALTITPLEILRIAEASDQLTVERNWILDAKRIVREREAKEIAEEALRGLLTRRAEREVHQARMRKIARHSVNALLWIACIVCGYLAATR